jgi:hypothetical protein
VADEQVIVWWRNLGNPPVMHRLRDDGKSACGQVDPAGQPYMGRGTGGVTTRANAESVPGIHKHQHRRCFE